MTGPEMESARNTGSEPNGISDTVRTELINPLLENYEALDNNKPNGYLDQAELEVTSEPESNQLKETMEIASKYLPEIQVLSNDEIFRETSGISKADLSGLGELAAQMETDTVLAEQIKAYSMRNFDRFNKNGDEILTHGEVANFDGEIAPADLPIHQKLADHVTKAGSKIMPKVAPAGGVVGYLDAVDQQGATRNDLRLYPEKVASSDNYAILRKIASDLNN